MSYHYEIPLALDLGKAVPEVGSLVNSVNANLTTLGVEERVAITGEVACLTLTVSRPLSYEEEETMRGFVREQFAVEELPLIVQPLRSKSGKSGSESNSK